MKASSNSSGSVFSSLGLPTTNRRAANARFFMARDDTTGTSSEPQIEAMRLQYSSVTTPSPAHLIEFHFPVARNVILKAAVNR
ncbi:hypothetical protein FHT97_003798 [Rhizobium sp. BK399]|nr:hypothetical protein [Rhizobium sp. BK399]